MRITEIGEYWVKVSLSADDCHSLAEVCDDWDQGSCTRNAHVKAMGAAFRAALVATCARYCGDVEFNR